MARLFYSSRQSEIWGQFRQIKDFGRSGHLFMTATFISGIAQSCWYLYFNFYILELGFNREFLGLVTAVNAMASLVLGIPLGLLSDHIGQKKALLLGSSVYVIATALEILCFHPYQILATAFLGGAGRTLVTLSRAPFMMKASGKHNRTLFFNLNYGLLTLSGAIGHLLASYLPHMLNGLLFVPPDGETAYRAVLITAVLISALTIVPFAMIREPDLQLVKGNQVKLKMQRNPNTISSLLKGTITRPVTVKLALPNFLIGLGGALLMPYLNIFLHNKFHISNQTMGIIFSLKTTLTGFGSLISPILVSVLKSKIRVIVIIMSVGVLFLLILGISKNFYFALPGFLIGGALLNMTLPLKDEFVMEQVKEHEQATMNSIKELSWQVGWTFGPFISGFVQENYGFSPLFIAASLLFSLATLLLWLFFRKTEIRPYTKRAVELI